MMGWLPQAASSFAPDLDRLLLTITIIVGAWFLVAEAILLGFAIRYRRRPGRRAAYLPAHGLRHLAFVLVPCAVILGFDLVIDALAAPVWEKVKLELPPHDQLVRIQGEAWQWRFTHAGLDGRLDTPDDVETVNEMHTPVDQTVLFELRARDVLHALWIPELRLKQDAVPGRSIRGWFRPTREGTYPVVCAEICGMAHTIMQGSLRVESPQAFEEWLRSRAPAPTAAPTS
jgi:cytochrome c oxidase subunit 2